MDPAADEGIDFGDEEYEGGHKMQYQGGGAIHALADDEMVNEDDEYDDLYNDVNVGDGFLQIQRPEAPLPAASGLKLDLHAPKISLSEHRPEANLVKDVNVPVVANTSSQILEQRSGLSSAIGAPIAMDASQQGRAQEIIHYAPAGNLGYQGSVPIPQTTVVNTLDMTQKIQGEAVPVLNTGPSRVVQHLPTNQMNSTANANFNHPIASESHVRPAVDNGNPVLFVGELQWWTTDAELESVLTKFGKVKELKFFDERASGKSKGYCQVEFYESAAAAACKEGMNGHVFNERACVVTFATPQSIKQIAASNMNKNQGQQAPPQTQGRRPTNDVGAGRGNEVNYPSGETGRNFGRGGAWRGRGQSFPNKGPGGGLARGRGGPMGGRNMIGNTPDNTGNGYAGGGGGFPQGQPGFAGPAYGGPPAGMMHPQAMMGPGFDTSFMSRGAGFGGFPGAGFPGMMPPFPPVNPMGMSGVAPHVNPAFFGRGMAPNGMGMMGTAGMERPHTGMWTDPNMGGWGGEEHGRRTRESSYVGDDNASEYGYGEASQDKAVRSNIVSQEKERGSERDWSGSSDRRHRDDREQDRDRYERDHRYKEEKDNFREIRQKERDLGYDDDWDRGQSSRSRSRSRANPEEDHKPRSRDADYGKRRRMPSE